MSVTSAVPARLMVEVCGASMPGSGGGTPSSASMPTALASASASMPDLSQAGNAPGPAGSDESGCNPSSAPVNTVDDAGYEPTSGKQPSIFALIHAMQEVHAQEQQEQQQQAQQQAH